MAFSMRDSQDLFQIEAQEKVAKQTVRQHQQVVRPDNSHTKLVEVKQDSTSLFSSALGTTKPNREEYSNFQQRQKKTTPKLDGL